MRPILKSLAVVSCAYLPTAAFGTALALQQDLPANFGGFLHGRVVLFDFLTMNGTALSPPLIFMVLQAVFTFFLFRAAHLQRIGVIGLTVLGAIYTIGQLGESITLRMLVPATFDPLQAVLVVLNLLLPLSMVVVGILSWKTTRSTDE